VEAVGQEGMHVVEHILLRPRVDGDPTLRACVDPTCGDCGGLDPYSYRLHVILPAYAGRFVDMDFRRFVEETIRGETPAHLLLKICWISRDDMARFEAAYRDWLQVAASAAAPEDRAPTLRRLFDALYEVKNVYPPTALGECGVGDETSQFILGRSALGSGVTEDQ
ncbi:MAG: diguanylate cyclase, partial [bacterium]